MFLRHRPQPPIGKGASTSDGLLFHNRSTAFREETSRRQWLSERDALFCSVQVATDMRKPDGQFAIVGEHGAISRFVDPLPIRKVPGIGKVRDSGACNTHLCFLTQLLILI